MRRVAKIQSADDCNRYTLGPLTHDKPCRACDHVGDSDLGHLQDPAIAIRQTASIDESRQSRSADRNLRHPIAPRSPEAVRYHDGDTTTDPMRDLACKTFGASVRIFGKQQDTVLMIAAQIGLVDPGIGHHMTSTMARDENARDGPDHVARFAQDHFDQASVLASTIAEFDRLLSGFHGLQVDKSPLDLRDDFLSDHQDVAIFERRSSRNC